MMTPEDQRMDLSRTERADFAEVSADSLVGAQVDNYHVLSVVGHGGFGTVYRARDIKLDRVVALKFLRDPLDVSLRESFEQEARAIAAVTNHPAIVQIHAWGQHQGRPYFAMEYIDGNAAQLLRQFPDGLPIATALRIAAECAEGLAAVHAQSILHLDMKPGNVMICAEDGRARIADFGLARFRSSKGVDAADGVSGSPPYMSPEQACGKSVDERSDIFSLGVTLYQLLSGRTPFEGTMRREILENIRGNRMISLTERRPDLPRDVLGIVNRALAFRPEDRYQTANELATDLRGALAGLQQQRPQERAIGHTRRVLRKVGSVALVLCVTMVLWAFAQRLINQHNGMPKAAALSEAADYLERGDLAASAAAYQAYLSKNPNDDDALYGLGYALLRQGQTDRAEAEFARLHDAALQLEAEAAAEYQRAGQDARPALEAAAGAANTAYPRALLANLDLLSENYQGALDKLQGVRRGDFQFGWQYAKALQALGQAHYRLGNYADAAAIFASLANTSDAEAGTVAALYLQLTQRKLDAALQDRVIARAKEIRQLIDEGKAPPPPEDEWTSRPLTFFVMPSAQRPVRLGLEAGLSDLLPTTLGDALSQDMELVERELINEVLTEQHLAALLSKDSGALVSGQFLGARLIIKCDVVELEENRGRIRTNVTEVETAKRIPVGLTNIEAPINLEVLTTTLRHKIWTAVRSEFPIQGRLYRKGDRAEINIGSAVGVRPGLTFDVRLTPDSHVLEDITVSVEAAEPGSAAVRIDGVGVDKLPDRPQWGWCVRERET